MTKNTLTLSIKADGAVGQDFGPEVALILRKLADQVEGAPGANSFALSLRASDGTRVGLAEYRYEPAKSPLLLHCMACGKEYDERLVSGASWRPSSPPATCSAECMRLMEKAPGGGWRLTDAQRDTATLRQLAAEAEERLDWSAAADLWKLAQERYPILPGHKTRGPLALSDLENMARRQADCRAEAERVRTEDRLAEMDVYTR